MMGMLIGGFVGMFSETSLNTLPQLMAQLHVSTATMRLVTGCMLMIGIVLPLSEIANGLRPAK